MEGRWWNTQGKEREEDEKSERGIEKGRREKRRWRTGTGRRRDRK